MKKILVGILVAGIGILILIQFVPFGRQHENPAVIQEPTWGSTEAKQIAQRACYDCHSNETVWPWYTNVAPMSWLVQKDVEEGRSKLNFSEWGQGEQEIEEVAEVLEEGEMPPRQYILLHPNANLSSAEQDILIRGLPGMAGRESSEHDDD